MIVVWDEPKRLQNLATHGLDFADARDRFEWDTALVISTHPGKRGGVRFSASGFLDGRLVTLVFSPLGREALSFISLRRASFKEGQSMPDAKRIPPPELTDEEARIEAGMMADLDNPEWTQDDFARARPAAEALAPDLYAALTKRPRGRPPVAAPKQQVTMRLDADLLAALRATGAGWQVRVNHVLRQWLEAGQPRQP